MMSIFSASRIFSIFNQPKIVSDIHLSFYGSNIFQASLRFAKKTDTHCFGYAGATDNPDIYPTQMEWVL